MGRSIVSLVLEFIRTKNVRRIQFYEGSGYPQQGLKCSVVIQLLSHSATKSPFRRWVVLNEGPFLGPKYSTAPL